MKNNSFSTNQKNGLWAKIYQQKRVKNNFSDNGISHEEEKNPGPFLTNFGLYSHENQLLKIEPGVALDNFYNKIFVNSKADSRKKVFGIVIFGGLK